MAVLLARVSRVATHKHGHRYGLSAMPAIHGGQAFYRRRIIAGIKQP